MAGKAVKILLYFCATILVVSWINEVRFEKPSHFPNPIYSFANNPFSVAKVNLGRALFYDPILSADGSISCASCHTSYNAFAHTDHPLSHGIFDSIGKRNAPALMNLAWQKHFMWDGAINHLDVQALAPITHPSEMANTLPSVIKNLGRTNLYPALFYEAFGDSSITTKGLMQALAQFQLSLVSANAKYDAVMRGETSFTAQEKNGYSLFLKHCNTCHTAPLFSSYEFAKNNLPLDSNLLDAGRGAISLEKRDSFAFKIPSLRNLSYTYPYMHDGRFLRLSEVLKHYQMVNILPKAGNIKPDLIAFLLTLNDSSFVFNKRFQYPKEIFFGASEGYLK